MCKASVERKESKKGSKKEETQTPCPLAGRAQALTEAAIRCLLLPLSLCFMIWTLLRSYLRKHGHARKMSSIGVSGTSEQLTILVSGGKMAKSLLVARCLWRLGHKVVLVETSKYWCAGSRFSRAVWKFETVSENRYVEEMVELVKKHNADMFIPVQSPAIVYQDAEIKRLVETDPDLKCKCPFFDVDLVQLTDDKHTFGTHCREHGLPAPATWKVCSPKDVLDLNRKLRETVAYGGHRYLLKNLSYDPIHRLDMFSLPQEDEDVVKAYINKVADDGNAITPQEPWQVQQFIGGKEYSACCVVRNRALLALTVCESSPSQINYIECQQSHVNMVVKKFVTELVTRTFPPNADGIFCLDFIVEIGEDGCSAVPYVIECNPRIHSQMIVYCQNSETMKVLGNALVSVESTQVEDGKLSVQSLVGKDCQLSSYYWMFNELFKIISPASYGSSNWKRFWNLAVADGNSFEADLDVDDPWPFIMRNHFQLPILLLGVAFRGIQWKKCDVNIGKVVEVGGD